MGEPEANQHCWLSGKLKIVKAGDDRGRIGNEEQGLQKCARAVTERKWNLGMICEALGTQQIQRRVSTVTSTDESATETGHYNIVFERDLVGKQWSTISEGLGQCTYTLGIFRKRPNNWWTKRYKYLSVVRNISNILSHDSFGSCIFKNIDLEFRVSHIDYFSENKQYSHEIQPKIFAISIIISLLLALLLSFFEPNTKRLIETRDIKKFDEAKSLIPAIDSRCNEVVNVRYFSQPIIYIGDLSPSSIQEIAQGNLNTEVFRRKQQKSFSHCPSIHRLEQQRFLDRLELPVFLGPQITSHQASRTILFVPSVGCMNHIGIPDSRKRKFSAIINDSSSLLRNYRNQDIFSQNVWEQ